MTSFRPSSMFRATWLISFGGQRIVPRLRTTARGRASIPCLKAQTGPPTSKSCQPWKSSRGWGVQTENTHWICKGKCHCTADLLFDWFVFNQTSKYVNNLSKTSECKPVKQEVAFTVILWYIFLNSSLPPVWPDWPIFWTLGNFYSLWQQ